MSDKKKKGGGRNQRWPGRGGGPRKTAGPTAPRMIAIRDGIRAALAGRVLVRLLLAVVPILAGVGCVYLIFLADHDINYYLMEKPPEWWQALAWAALLLAGLALVLLWLFAGWILSLSMVLFQE